MQSVAAEGKGMAMFISAECSSYLYLLGAPHKNYGMIHPKTLF